MLDFPFPSALGSQILTFGILCHLSSFQTDRLRGDTFIRLINFHPQDRLVQNLHEVGRIQCGPVSPPHVLIFCNRGPEVCPTDFRQRDRKRHLFRTVLHQPVHVGLFCINTHNFLPSRAPFYEARVVSRGFIGSPPLLSPSLRLW